MKTEITAIGNEGFRIVRGGRHVFVDAFYHSHLSVGSAPTLGAVESAPGLLGRDFEEADLILVTHAHADHFDESQVAEIARRTDVAVAGPVTIAGRLRALLGKSRVVELEPEQALAGRNAAARSADLGGIRVTAFRTFHSRDHNSYRVDLDGFRFFHDGDNEDTRRIDIKALGPIDALFIGPWQGSGWVEFVETVGPARWFLMHLNDEELDQHEQGRFLPDLCDHIPLPDRLVVLRPGQTCAME